MKVPALLERNQVGLEGPKDFTFDLVIFGVSIRQFIDPSKIAKCEPSKALNYSTSGDKVKDIFKQFEKFENQYVNASVKNVIIHVGASHHRDDVESVSRMIRKLVTFICEKCMIQNLFVVNITKEKPKQRYIR